MTTTERRCKTGDFAIFTGVLGKPKNEKTVNRGEIVRCVRWLGKVKGVKHEDQWRIDKTLVNVNTGKRDLRRVRDANLTPLTGTAEEIIAQIIALKCQDIT